MIDLSGLDEALVRHGRVARVVVAGVEGSTPREAGAGMLVWAQGQAGTIGGGALEWQAVAAARAMLAAGGARVDRMALGPGLGQCCGGAVTLVTEVFTALPQEQAGLVVRRVAGETAMPLAVARMIDRARARGEAPGVRLVHGWLVEPVAVPVRQIWIWGAGHVGRALVGVLAPLPGVAITWVDVARERFPEMLPAGVECRWADDPGALVSQAPAGAEHLVLTFSHALDLDLCHRLLQHGFGQAGLIGSATKWARFRSRLGGLGHAPDAIARIRCPIGDPALGKHPQAIAIGVAAEFLATPAIQSREIRA